MIEALQKMAEIVGTGYPPEGQFEVFCILGGKAISKPASWDKAWQDLESHCYAGGAGMGLDVRRVGEKS